MAQGVQSVSPKVESKGTVVDSKFTLTMDKVVVKERQIIVDIPEIKYFTVEYEKPVVHEKVIETIKYNISDHTTDRYNIVDKETIKYNVKQVECEKPIIKEVVYEKPIVKEVVYEKPIVETKKITVLEVQDLDHLLAFAKVIKELKVEIEDLKKQISSIKNYRLVEEVVTVPKIEWNTVKAERIEWIPVKREMPNVKTHA